jgi:hypothetical protein
MRPFDFDSLRAEQEALFDWLSSLGFAKQDRLRRHGDNVRDLIAGRLDAAISAEKGREVLWSIGESLEFVEACRVIRERQPRGFVNVLKQALDGPVDPGNEQGASNRGRNAMFELVVAAHLAAGGFNTQFRENPDVHAELEGTTVRVECKRPQSSSSTDRLVYEGAKQLRKTANTGAATDLGVVAVSATRLFDEKSSAGVATFNSVDEMCRAHHGALHRFIHGLTKTIEQIKRHRVNALLVHSAFPARVLNQARQFTFQERMMVAPVAMSADQGRRLREIFDHVSAFY